MLAITPNPLQKIVFTETLKSYFKKFETEENKSEIIVKFFTYLMDDDIYCTFVGTRQELHRAIDNKALEWLENYSILITHEANEVLCDWLENYAIPEVDEE